jgi:hypothetical protein
MMAPYPIDQFSNAGPVDWDVAETMLAAPIASQARELLSLLYQ